MKLAIFLAAVTVGLSFTMALVAQNYGSRVADRFLERGQYSESDLNDFIISSPTAARGYAIPVLFPCDLLFMVALGGFLGFGSVAAAESIEAFERVAWLFAIGPILYVAFDLIEDILLARLLLSPKSVTAGAVRLAQVMTAAKLIACGYGILQTVSVSAAALIAQ